MNDTILSHFVRNEAGQWVCKFAIRLSPANGPGLSLLSGNIVTQGSYCVDGKDLAAELDSAARIREDMHDVGGEALLRAIHRMQGAERRLAR